VIGAKRYGVGLSDRRLTTIGSRGYTSSGFFLFCSPGHIALFEAVVKLNKLRDGSAKVGYLKYAFYNGTNHNIGPNLYSRRRLYNATLYQGSKEKIRLVGEDRWESPLQLWTNRTVKSEA